MKNKYKVLSGVKTIVVVEKKNLTKKQAEKLSKKVGGVYCGSSEGSPHKKIRGNRFKKGMHCERVKTKIIEDN